jgi:hypothetical protein
MKKLTIIYEASTFNITLNSNGINEQLGLVISCIESYSYFEALEPGITLIIP